MPVSNSVIRRYTPPTCTLEVLAQSSALSKWMGKSVLKQLRFELRFDDPQLPEEKRIAIVGDRNQLEVLCAAVTNYVQEFLQMSPESFWASFLEPKDSNTATDDSEAKDINHSSQQTNILNSFSTQMPGADIHIQPSSYLAHNLFLGSLANQASGAVIQLSLLQLFDLATALDEYSADVVALPTLNSRTTVSPTLPAWAPVAAVLVLGVGLIPVTLQYANSIRKQQQTAKKPTPAQEKIALESVSPSLNLSTPIPTLSPPNSLPPFQQPLPLGSNLPLPSSSLPLTTQTPPISALPASPVSPNSSLPRAVLTSPNLTTLPSGTLPSTGTQITIPSTTTAQTRTTSGLNTSPLTLPSQTNPKQNSTAIPQGGISSVLPDRNLPTGTISPSISAVPPPLGNIPSSSSENDSRNETYLQPDNSVAGNANSLATRLREGRNNTKTASTEVATNSSTLFDTPQVVEAREFLKKRWQPPTGLKQPIEYTLVLGIDGSIERILPLGKAARDFVDRTGMPLIGERFVSPNINGQSLKMRAVFSPDGKVQTFPETE